MRTVIDILKDCSEYYSIGNLYTITEEDRRLLEQEGYSISEGIEVEDSEYDNIYFYLKDKFPLDPFFNTVGAPERGNKVPLEFKMGSMNELKSGDWDKWKILESDYVITSKLDGISCGLTFEGGKLKCAQSRGNGIEGADVTRHYIKFKNQGFIKDGKVRGEVIIPKKDINAFLDEVEKETGKRYKNARNAVAGQMNSKKAVDAFYKYAHFVSYKLIDYDDNLTFEESLNTLKENGFYVAAIHGVKKGKDITEDNLIDCVKSVKEKDGYECDGIIITMNTPDSSHTGTETNSLNPRDSRKFKIGATNLTAITTIVDIEWNPSKDYKMKPVAILKPVNLNGVTVSRATVNNFEWMSDRKAGIGADVIIKRCGEVIPNIIEVLKESEDWGLPEEVLQSCERKGVDLCLKEDCQNTTLKSLYTTSAAKKILYFCSSLKIEQAGFANILAIINSSSKEPNEYTVEDFLKEDKSIFIKVIGVNGEKLFESLRERLSKVSEPAFYAAVGIFNSLIAEKRLEKIFEIYNTVDVTDKELESIPGFAEETINAYKEGRSELKRWVCLCENDFKDLIHFKKVECQSSSLSDMSVVFTGFRDSELEDIVKNNGGKVLSSVSKNCNLVVAKALDSGSSKIKKATSLGIEVMSLNDFKEKIKGCV